MESPATPLLPALVIDGSSTRFFAGVLSGEEGWASKITSEDAPLEGLFTTVERVIGEAEIELSSIRSFIYCEGPGSVLGLRLCAMAIETWRRLNPEGNRLFAFSSLNLAASALMQDEPTLENALVISDWKKDAWNSLEIIDGKMQSVQPICSADVESYGEALYHLPARKGWQAAPDGARELGYQPERLPELIAKDALLRQTKEIELYSAGANTFQKWTPERHRAPAT